MQQHQINQPILLDRCEEETELAQEFSLDLETLDVEELEQRLEMQSIGVLFHLFGDGGGSGGSCSPTGCGW